MVTSRAKATRARKNKLKGLRARHRSARKRKRVTRASRTVRKSKR